MRSRTIQMTQHEGSRYEICQELISGELSEAEAEARLIGQEPDRAPE
jgi:hypothetical protein